MNMVFFIESTYDTAFSHLPISRPSGLNLERINGRLRDIFNCRVFTCSCTRFHLIFFRFRLEDSIYILPIRIYNLAQSFFLIN